MSKMNPVVHFEMPAENSDRMAAFYTKAFGWQTQKLGPEMGEYVLVTTTEVDDKGTPQKIGCINGGFFERSPEIAAKHPSLVIEVDDIGDSVRLVQEAGGRTLGEPHEIPGVGWFVYFTDTEGNVTGMMQPFPQE